MQKRSIPGLMIEHAPIRLPEAFPCTASERYVLSDAPILHLHRHDCLEIGYCYSGAGMFMVDQKTPSFQGGDVSVINSLEFHLASSMKGTSSTWTWLHVDPQRLLGPTTPDLALLNPLVLSGAEFNNVVTPRQDPELGGLVKVLIAELQDRSAGYEAVARGVMWAIMGRLKRLPGVKEAGGEPVAQGKRLDALGRVAPALLFMMRQYPRRMSMAHLATLCGMSEVNFRRVFQAAAGTAPLEYLMRLRIRMAATMLETTLRSVSDIATETGFPTLSSFNRQFRAILATSPREWRKRTQD